MKPNPKQMRFVEEYLVDFNGAQAAIRAGYSEKCAREIAHNLLTKVHIKELITTRSQQTAKKLEITREAIMNQILEAITLAKMQANPVAMVRGCAELNKMCGFYEPDTEIVELSEDQTRLLAQVHSMTDSELLARLG